jgi:hypothetical protein
MTPVEHLSYRRPVAIGGPVLLGRERRMPTQPYTVHAGEDNECPQCHSMNERDAHYCDQCGAKMPGGPVGAAAAEGVDETHQCQSCLSMNATDAKYCDQCGAGLAGITPWRKPGGGYSDDYGSGRPVELRASAGDSIDIANSPDYNPSYDVACPACQAPNDADANYCDQCGKSMGQSATVTVDATTGIPGEESQFSAARRLELRMRELEMDELAHAG